MITDKLQELIISYLGPEKLVGTFFHILTTNINVITLIMSLVEAWVDYCMGNGGHAQSPTGSINGNIYFF